MGTHTITKSIQGTYTNDITLIEAVEAAKQRVTTVGNSLLGLMFGDYLGGVSEIPEGLQKNLIEKTVEYTR